MGIGSILFGFIGAFVRWMFKGFKGSFKDTLNGPSDYELPDKAAYEMTNNFIGAFTILILWALMAFVKCN